jgi:hypothetical protein
MDCEFHPSTKLSLWVEDKVLMGSRVVDTIESYMDPWLSTPMRHDIDGKHSGKPGS